MPVDVTIPSPGESITEVVLTTWRVEPGQWVEKDDPLCEIETDKVTMDIPAPESGRIELKADEGAELEVGAVIASIDPDAEKPAGAKAPSEAKREGAEAAKPEPAAAGASAAKAGAPTPAGTSVGPVEAGGDGEHRATSVARKIAADRGIDLGGIRGTGPSGRIRKADVLAASEKPRAATERAASPAPAPSGARTAGERGVRREKLSRLRQRIAERLVQAQQTAAMLTTFNECDMTEVMRLRKAYKESFEKKHGVGLGFMSFFVKAAVAALEAFPKVNAYFDGDELEYHDFVDVSIAVGTEKGLVVPVVRNAESLSFAEIEAEINRLATRARDGQLTIDEMTGGTFTLSNGGIYGSLNSTPILNPPQSAILGMHAIKKRPVEDPTNPGQLALRPMMYLALSYDHRIIDGAEAVQFLGHIKDAIEQPERLLLGV